MIRVEGAVGVVLMDVDHILRLGCLTAELVDEHLSGGDWGLWCSWAELLARAHVGSRLLQSWVLHQHLVVLLKREIALVACVSEGEVEIAASLALPVAGSLLDFVQALSELGKTGSLELWAGLRVGGLLLQQGFRVAELPGLVEPLLLVLGGLEGELLLLWFEHVLWPTGTVLDGLRLLASMALLAALEVVVLALGAFPSSIREFEAAVLALFGVLLLCVFRFTINGF